MAQNLDHTQNDQATGSTFSLTQTSYRFAPRPRWKRASYLYNILVRKSRAREEIRFAWSTTLTSGASTTTPAAIVGQHCRITIGTKKWDIVVENGFIELTNGTLRIALWDAFQANGSVKLRIQMADSVSDFSGGGGDAPSTPTTPTNLAPTDTNYRRRPDVGAVIQQRRDIQFADTISTVRLPTTENDHDDLTPHVRTNGTVNPTYQIMNLQESGISISANKKRTAGVYLTGPDETKPDLVIYKLVGMFASNGHLEILTGAGPKAPGTDAAGQVAAGGITIDCSPAGQPLLIDRLLALQPWPASIAGRPVLFALSVFNLTNTRNTGIWVRGTMSVQRLAGPPPAMLDRRYG